MPTLEFADSWPEKLLNTGDLALAAPRGPANCVSPGQIFFARPRSATTWAVLKPGTSLALRLIARAIAFSREEFAATANEAAPSNATTTIPAATPVARRRSDTLTAISNTDNERPTNPRYMVPVCTTKPLTINPRRGVVATRRNP